MTERDSLVNLTNLLAQPKRLQAEASQLQRSTAWDTMASRGFRGFKQYGIYFAGMWIGGLRYGEQADLIRSGCFYWRWVDDVADGDRPLPKGYTTRREFLQRRDSVANLLFFHSEETIYGDREDILLAHYYFLARKRGIDLTRESFDILESIVWDEERARNRRVLTQQELNDGLNKLDFACIDGGFKVAEESYSSQDLFALSWAVRTMFNLRDFPKDFAKGIINISAEDIERYEVDLTRLEGRSTIEELIDYGSTRDWYRDQIRYGKNFLDQALSTLGHLRLKWISRAVVNVNFVGPTQRNLDKYAAMLAV